VTFYRLVAAVLLVASLAVIALAFKLHPDPTGVGTHEQLGLPPCGFLQDHGVPCISCGMTTAFAAMAHLQPGLAVRSNPFGAVLFLVVLASPIWLAHALVTGRDPLRILNGRGASIALPLAGVALLVNWGVMVLLAKT
jgi:hypothetical protein